MVMSVRMDPLLEKELELAAQRQGITKSQFVPPFEPSNRRD